MSKERRLGRGLAALLGAPLQEEVPMVPPASELGQANALHATPPMANPTISAQQLSQGDLVYLAVDLIDRNPFQPRREFDDQELESLAASLRQHSMLQPILVRPVSGRYQLISGERRLRAAIKVGWGQVPCRIREADDRIVAELAIVENLQRKDLNPIEKAMSFDRYLQEHKCTHEELAKRLDVDRSTISNMLRLLELPNEVLDAVGSGSLSPGHARALLPLSSEAEQMKVAKRIKEEDLSVRAAEELVRVILDGEDRAESQGTSMEPATLPFTKKPRSGRTSDAQIQSIEKELRKVIGSKVQIRQHASGRGKIVIHFASGKEFGRIVEQLFLGEFRDVTPRKSTP